jgi:hypothetical protein
MTMFYKMTKKYKFDLKVRCYFVIKNDSFVTSGASESNRLTESTARSG